MIDKIIISKLILSVDPLLQNYGKLTYEVAFFGSRRTQGTVGAAGLSLPAVGASSLPHDTPSPAASWQPSWELAPDGVGQAAARHSLLPCSPSWAQLIIPQCPSSQSCCSEKRTEMGSGNGSVLFALLLLKDFLYILKRQLISDLIT